MVMLVTTIALVGGAIGSLIGGNAGGGALWTRTGKDWDLDRV